MIKLSNRYSFNKQRKKDYGFYVKLNLASLGISNCMNRALKILEVNRSSTILEIKKTNEFKEIFIKK
jgi:hypothetical protein